MLTIAPILLLALAVVLLVRKGTVKILPAVTIALFGYFLASTSVSPDISHGLNSVMGWLGSIQV